MQDARIIVAGKLEIDGWYNQMRTVYDPEGIAPTLGAHMGTGGDKIKIIVRESEPKNE